MDKEDIVIITLIVIAGLAIVAGFYFGILVPLLMWSWNALMPGMFGLAEITYVKTIALSILLGAFNLGILKQGVDAFNNSKSKNS